MSEQDYGIWSDAADVAYAAGEAFGLPFLSIESKSLPFGALVLGTEVQSVEPRLVAEGLAWAGALEKGEKPPQQFVLSINKDMACPLLIVPHPIDPIMQPLLEVMEARGRFLLFLQVMAVNESGTAQPCTRVLECFGEDEVENKGLLDYWPVIARM